MSWKDRILANVASLMNDDMAQVMEGESSLVGDVFYMENKLTQELHYHKLLYIMHFPVTFLFSH